MPRPVGMRNPSHSNTNPTGIPQGTLGGRGANAASRRPGRRTVNLGDEMYLWILVLLEVGTMGWLRHQFRRHHGG